ncbi:protoporphyrinogen oxidase [Paenibacillus bovis]|uniref:Coproporphyrinogen III oxidase n=1 Tax=Paenibacillus bovis TaxID=1616788 RepID=A0A172ZHJ7_9BACL|nr:protoporphyrinogen oxidase [Paenibacillus bovis]ANF97111.1 protoporphyrinogen oxidase [Paenibacillus bovis]
MTPSSIRKIVVLGGGITGLSAAYYARKAADQQGIPVEITLIESSNRLGGKIHSVQTDGFLIEKGPDSFLARKQPIIDLTHDLGMNEQLVPTNPKAGSAYILHKKKLHQMPMGLVLGIPTKISPFIRTGLISPLGKARAILDMVLPARKADEDEALGDFIERRLGREVLEQMTEPLLAGIYAGDTRSLSLLSTFPQFRQMEKKHHSLIIGMARGMLRRPAGHKTIQQKNGTHAGATSPMSSTSSPVEPAAPRKSKSMFLSYQYGLSAMIRRLQEQLTMDQVQFRMEESVTQIAASDSSTLSKRGKDGSSSTEHTSRYTLTLSSGEHMNADSIICTIPAYAAAELLGDIPEIQQLNRIHYVSVANIALGYKHHQLQHEFEGTGFLVPRKENRMITACTWSSTKWKHTAPSGQTLLRTYIGRAGAEEWTSLSNEELVQAVRRDLRDLIGFDAEPDLVEISRCYRSMPQYPVGHGELMDRVRASLAAHLPDVWLCGAGYGGIGIPDCVQHGREAAEELISRWAVN